VELLQLAGMLDEHVLRDLIQLLGGLDSLALRFDDARVHNVQGSQVLHGAGATDGVVVPARLGHERSRRARWRPAERGDPLGGLVDHAAHGVHLRVQHHVHRDEVRPDRVPVHVLQCERQVVERVEPVLQQPDDSLGAVWALSGFIPGTV
jgi:hypothetical protein